MGMFSKMFTATGTRCDACGKSFEPPQQLMTIITTDISQFSRAGIGGYCPSCHKYLCESHLEFKKTDSSGIMWAIACTTCGTPIATHD